MIEKMYMEEANNFNEIVKEYEALKENDIEGAFKLMKNSLQAFNRWSVIRVDIRKGLKRGEATEIKNRLEDILRYLKEVNTEARMIWKQAYEGYKSEEGIN